MSETRGAKFWDCRQSETLTFTASDDAIEDFLDDGKTPETIEVHGFAPKELPSVELIKVKFLEDLLDCFDDDEEYGNPEEKSGATQRMKDAALLFAATFRREYSVWTCEKVCTKTINVKEWVKDHPDYIERTDE